MTDTSMTRVPVWTGLDPTPGVWDAWRIAIVGIAGERGVYDLLVPAEGAQIKVEREANRNLWFLLARATGSPAVGVLTAYSHIANDCGVQRLFVIDDSAQLITGSREPYFWLECYMRAANQLAVDAQVEGVLGEWLFAFARGVSCALTLHSHTDEGGYAHHAMRYASYPTPRGWVNAVRDRNAFKIFTIYIRTEKYHALADCVELLLQAAGLLHDAEPYASGIEGGDAFATLLHHEPVSGEPRVLCPSDYPGLLSVLQTWYDHAVRQLPVWQGHSVDTRRYTGNIWEHYCQSVQHDRHLGRSDSTRGLLPFCWVEASCVNLNPGGCRLPGPGGINNERGLTYLNTDVHTGFDGSIFSEDRRGCVIGDTEMYRISHWQLRAQGMTYLCHSRFSHANGLDALHFRLADTHSTALADEINFARAGRTESTIADQAWVRPHCPIPFNGEVSIVGDAIAGIVCQNSKGTIFFCYPSLPTTTAPTYHLVISPTLLADNYTLVDVI